MFVILYVLIMALYLFLKHKFPMARQMVIEVLTLGIAALLIISLRVGTSIWIIQTDPSIYTGSDRTWYVILQIFTGIYTFFGTVGYEGVTLYDSDILIVLQIAHYDLSILIGLLGITLLASTFSHEIYSFIALHLRLNRNIHYYVFTDLNENSLMLANSIREAHLTGSKKGHKFVIVFAGSSLRPFDRSDPLCVAVVKNNYLYQSTKKHTRKALVTKLGIGLRQLEQRGLKDEKVIQYEERIHIFAFAMKDELVADEVDNAQIVFEEMKCLIKNRFKKEQFKKDKLTSNVVNLYVLTQNDNDFQLYNEKKKAIFNEFNLNDKANPKFSKVVNRLLQLHLINEAELTARDFSRNRTNSLNQGKDLVKALSTPDNQYHALILGFGHTGERVLEQLYMDTTYVVGNTLPVENRFIATVIDNSISERVGLYSARHPYFITTEVGENDDFLNQDLRKLYLNPKSSISKYYDDRVKRLIDLHFDSQPLTQTQFPLIVFKEEEVKSSNMMKIFENNTGTPENSIFSFNTIVISLGDDDENIALANAIIADARKEFIQRKGKIERPQVIAVHIRNKDNYFKLDILYPNGENKLPLLHVFGFGMSSKVFDYNLIVDHSEAQRHNSMYDYLYSKTEKVINDNGGSGQFSQNVLAIQTEISRVSLMAKSKELEDRLAYSDVIMALNDDMLLRKKEIALASLPSWLDLPQFQKVIRQQAVQSVDILREIINEDANHSLVWCASLEHSRWNRFHIAYGWRYSRDRMDHIKYHDCLTDLKNIPVPKNIYDVITLMAIKGPHTKNILVDDENEIS